MKKQKNNKIDEYIFLESDYLLSGLIFSLSQENEILRKKINNEKLSKEEEFFDNYIFSPSIILRMIKRRIKK